MIKVEVRKAFSSEARFIARNVMAAMGADVFNVPFSEEAFTILESLTGICGRTDTLYSYKNTLVATVSDIPVGTLTAYNGADYVKMRDLTFSIVKEETGFVLPEMDDETGPGEYYLDSLAVIPSMRGHHVAKTLIRQSLEIADGLGFTKVSLIVKKGDDKTKALYEECGFEEDGIRNCFGHEYVRMVNIIG